MNEVLKFQSEWINTDKDKGKTDKENERLYVCNTQTGDMKRIFDFHERNLVEHFRKIV
jgi:hypothetical protein